MNHHPTHRFLFICRCRGLAINYLVSVISHRSCLDACNRDDRCCSYSYHGFEIDHPDHNSCYLFSARECDTEDLMFEDIHTQWRTGNRTTVLHNCHPYENSIGPELSLLSFPRNPEYLSSSLGLGLPLGSWNTLRELRV